LPTPSEWIFKIKIEFFSRHLNRRILKQQDDASDSKKSNFVDSTRSSETEINGYVATWIYTCGYTSAPIMPSMRQVRNKKMVQQNDTTKRLPIRNTVTRKTTD